MRRPPSFDVESFVRILRHLLAAHDGVNRRREAEARAKRGEGASLLAGDPRAAALDAEVREDSGLRPAEVLVASEVRNLTPAEEAADLARLAEQWRSFDFLPEILRNAPGALESAQVRAALEALRAERRARAEKDVPDELAALLRRVGDAIAKPAKVKKPDATRRVLILNLWAARHAFDDDERERRARALGLKDWDSLSARVRGWKTKRRG